MPNAECRPIRRAARVNGPVKESWLFPLCLCVCVAMSSFAFAQRVYVDQVEIDGKPAGTWQLGQDGYLYRRDASGRAIGAYDPERRLWIPKIDGAYRMEDAIPYVRGSCDNVGPRNKGLCPSWLEAQKKATGETVSIGGKATSIDTALAALGQTVPAYSKMGRIVVVSADQAVRDQVLRDFREDAALAEFQGRVLVDAYPPDHWHLEPFALGRNPDFQRTGFALLVQAPPGPHGRSKPYALWTYPGAKALAAALRRPGPDYDPSRIDRLPLFPFSPGEIQLGLVALILAAIVLVGLFVFRRK